MVNLARSKAKLFGKKWFLDCLDFFYRTGSSIFENVVLLMRFS